MHDAVAPLALCRSRMSSRLLISAARHGSCFQSGCGCTGGGLERTPLFCGPTRNGHAAPMTAETPMAAEAPMAAEQAATPPALCVGATPMCRVGVGGERVLSREDVPAPRNLRPPAAALRNRANGGGPAGGRGGPTRAGPLAACCAKFQPNCTASRKPWPLGAIRVPMATTITPRTRRRLNPRDLGGRRRHG